jgi:hypothetical protein
LGDLEKQGKLSADQAATLKKERAALRTSVDYAPTWVLTLPASILVSGVLFLLFRSIIPDAQAATTASVTFVDPGSDRSTAVMPVLGRPLRLP